jgi:hypothetical protein
MKYNKIRTIVVFVNGFEFSKELQNVWRPVEHVMVKTGNVGQL